MSHDTASPNDTWELCLQVLKGSLSQTSFETWFAASALQELRPVGDDRAIAVISCQTSFHSSTLEKNFYAQIKEVLDDATQKKCELQFRVGSQHPHSITPPPATPLKPQSSSPDLPLSPLLPQPPHPSETLSSPASPTYQHSLVSIRERLASLAQQSPYTPPPSSASINPSKQKHSTPQESGLFSESTLLATTVDRSRVIAEKSGIRPDYTFETFAVSASNEMAHAAALAVSVQPGKAYNPLFLYGGVGVGKTHLLHAVGNNIIAQNPDKKVLYCTGEEFMNEIVQAIRTKKTILFKEKFRSAHVLMIDDIHFIAGKTTVQEEFFHTFNAIVQHGGQIILTSDRPSEDIPLLEDRLRSRFQAGLVVDIQQPSFELRIAIVLIKSQALQLQLPMHLAQSVAAKVDSARKIEGLLQKLVSEVRLKHNEITLDLIEKILGEEERKSPPRFTMKPHDLIRRVADFYHSRPLALRGKQRTKNLVHARHVAMYLFHQDLHLTLVEIGQLFSARDHTSVLHGVEKVKTELLTDPQMQSELSRLRLSLTS